MARITEIHGNIFQSGCKVIVNTVNCVGVMGRGIALEYKYRFPEMYQSYKKVCDNKELRPGLLQLWTKSTPWILNFPTKNHWRLPSKIEYIEAGFIKFSDIYFKKDITSIAFPILGSSAGGLDEKVVIDLMRNYLTPLKNLDVEIYHFDPNASDTLFDKLYQRIHRFEIKDFKNYIDIPTAQASKIISGIKNHHIKTMLDFQKIEGVGEKTLEKIYKFLEKDFNRIKTSSETQLKLF